MRPLSLAEVYRQFSSNTSPYEAGYYYCPFCGGWWHKNSVRYAPDGWPICPIHGRKMRTRSRIARKGKMPFPEVEL